MGALTAADIRRQYKEIAMGTTSHWRRESQRAIAAVLERNPGLVDFDILEAIDKAYPFGPRKHLPYKMWLEERRKTMARISTNPLLRVCGTCNASIAKPCRDIGTNHLAANTMVLEDARKERKPPEVIRQLEIMCCHASRLAHLPTFEAKGALDLIFKETT